MSAFDTTVLSTAIGGIIGGSTGCVLGCCNPCVGVMGMCGGAAVGFAIPAIAYTTAAVANAIFSGCAFVVTGTAQAIAFSLQAVGSVAINHPYVAAAAVLGIAVLMVASSHEAHPAKTSRRT